MKVTELRIGNWLDNGEGSNYVIDTSSMMDILDEAQVNNGETYWKPIPLTEEWLVKFGFDGRVDFKWKRNVGIQIVGGDYYFAFKDMGNVIFRSIVECKYVHQLQNLYFAVTREELELKP